MKKINVGVIGLGVGYYHAENIIKNKYCNLKVVCDFDKKKLKDLDSRFKNVIKTKDSNKIFSDKSIDLVCIASFDNYHFRHVKSCIDKNKHIFVEKPICLKTKELSEIIKLLKKNKTVKLSSNFVLRTHPSFIGLKKEINNRSFGRIYFSEGSYNYGRIEKILYGWRSKIPYYSIIHGGGLHIIDLILWLFNKKLSKVRSLGNKIVTNKTNFKFKDFVISDLIFTDKSISRIISNFGCVYPHTHKLSIYGSKKTFNYEDNQHQYIRKIKKLEINNKKIKKKNIIKSKVLNSFIDSILSKKKAMVSKEEVINSMRVSLALEKSLKFGKWQKVEYKTF